jgi:hypothetical protein
MTRIPRDVLIFRIGIGAVAVTAALLVLSRLADAGLTLPVLMSGAVGLLLLLALVLAVPVAFGLACSFVANSKGYDRQRWFWFGLLGMPIALLAICGAGDRLVQANLRALNRQG